MEFQYIPLSNINQNFKYNYRSKNINPELFDSIKKNGVLEPVWLISGDPLIVIEGHQRIIAAKKFDLNSLAVLVFQRNQLAELFCKSLELNLSRGLSLLERLNAVLRAESHFDLQTLDKIITIIGLNRHPALPVILNYIKTIPDWLFEYLHHINIQFKNINKLTGYPVEFYSKWLNLCAELNFKSVEMLNLLENLHDISLRDSIHPDEIWHQFKIDEIRQSQLTPQQQVRQVKERIAHTRAPLFHQINETVQDSAKELERLFNGNLQIKWDYTMEVPGISLHMQLRDSGNVGDQLKLFQEPNVLAKIKSTIDLMENIPEEDSHEKR